MATRGGVIVAAVVLGISMIAGATPQVWSGGGAGDVVFSKAGLADPTQAANQDQITASVHLTRGSTGGLYNIASEAFFTRLTSPADTEWAFSGLQTNPVFAYGAGAAGYAGLSFSDLTTAGNSSLGNFIINLPGVLHLITDDVYIDIQITTWVDARTGGGGGAVTYTRAPEPATLGVLGLGALAVLKRRRRR